MLTSKDKERILDFRPVLNDNATSLTEEGNLAEPSLREFVYKYYARYFDHETAIKYAKEYLTQVLSTH